MKTNSPLERFIKNPRSYIWCLNDSQAKRPESIVNHKGASPLPTPSYCETIFPSNLTGTRYV